VAFSRAIALQGTGAVRDQKNPSSQNAMLVAVEGIPGIGKSALTRQLVEVLGYKYRAVSLGSFPHPETPLGALLHADPSDYPYLSGNLDAVYMLSASERTAFQPAVKDALARYDVVLVESYWDALRVKTAVAAARKRASPDTLRIVERLARQAEAPGLTLYLGPAPDRLPERCPGDPYLRALGVPAADQDVHKPLRDALDAAHPQTNRDQALLRLQAYHDLYYDVLNRADVHCIDPTQPAPERVKDGIRAIVDELSGGAKRKFMASLDPPEKRPPDSKM
jgi:thymidylate kinase